MTATRVYEDRFRARAFISFLFENRCAGAFMGTASLGERIKLVFIEMLTGM